MRNQCHVGRLTLAASRPRVGGCTTGRNLADLGEVFTPWGGFIRADPFWVEVEDFGAAGSLKVVAGGAARPVAGVAADFDLIVSELPAAGPGVGRTAGAGGTESCAQGARASTTSAGVW